MAAVVGVDVVDTSSADQAQQIAQAYLEQAEQRRLERQRREPARVARREAARARLLEQDRVNAMIGSMPREERTEYELEGCLPITQPIRVVDEDLDPTPPLLGCARCWERCLGSAACQNCPDPKAPAKMKAHLRERRAAGEKPVSFK